MYPTSRIKGGGVLDEFLGGYMHAAGALKLLTISIIYK